MSQEPDAVLNLRTTTATVIDNDGAPYLALADGDTTVHLKPCADGASPEAMNGIDSVIQESGALWDLLRAALRRQLDQVGEKG